MTEIIQLGPVSIEVTRKQVKHVHLSVHPPDGRVTLVAPTTTRLDVARTYAISRLGWIRGQQEKLREQARESPREFVTRESHYVWGQRYLLEVEERPERPDVSIDHRRILLCVRVGADRNSRAAVMHAWHKRLLHETVPPLVSLWEGRLGVGVAGYFLQRMKTKWGSCNTRSRHIRLNTELVKKPKELLEYVIVHEMAHLIAPTHDQHFVALMDRYWPTWREARAELNELPLGAEAW